MGDVALDILVRQLVRAERRQASELDATTLLQLAVRGEGSVVAVEAEAGDGGGEVRGREDGGGERGLMC